MMTGMERLQAVMTGRQPDRIPVLCNLLDQGAQELGMSMKEYYSLGENVAEGQLRMREKYGYDAVLGMFYVGMEAELFGCRNIVYAEDGPPNVGHMVIQSPEDIPGLQVPADFNDLPRFRELSSCIRILKERAAGRFPVIGVVTGSFSLPALLMGISGWMELFLCGDPDLRSMLLDKCSQFCSRQIEALREAGADLIVYTNSVATANFITLSQFKALALPSVLKDLQTVGTGGVVYFNGGGRINPHLSTLLEQTALRAFYINPFDDISEAKETLGGQALLVAAINDISLILWTEEDIEREVKRIMEAGKPGGGFIFSTLMMPCAIPEKNIRAMLDAAYRYGTING
jgi:uroporphyrinogen decarboxylase